MTVTSIHRYPVKSMLGESLPSCRLDQAGIPGDRAYALIDTETGDVASAKVPRRWAELLRFSARYVQEPEPGNPPMPVEITFPDGRTHRSDDPDIDEILSKALGRPVQLSSAPAPGSHFEELWPEIDGLAPQQFIDGTASRHEDSGEVISRIRIAAFAPQPSFVDVSTLHLLTEATLRRLRELAADATFDARRYRPNLLLDPDEPGFAENTWPGRNITFAGGTQITATLPTMRCVMTTLAQGDLPSDADTLRTIARHNRLTIPDLGTWACAGVYADVTEPGEIQLGDSFSVEPR